jgi:glycosyltransferase involved in cell wall biosynthesis
MSVEPLISCLCITRDRVPFLRRAIQCFRDQRYLNKELVIVFENDDLSTKKFLKQVSDKNILKIETVASSNLTLGELRNLSIRKCNGEYFCQWDDDDWSHSKRLEFQMDVIQKSQKPACVMMHWLVFDTSENQAYISYGRPWEGSILCEKSLITEEHKYENIKRGEDKNIIKTFVSKNLTSLVAIPKLYVYVYHGNNLWSYDHWDYIFRTSTKLSAESSRIVKETLEGKHSGEKASEMLDAICDKESCNEYFQPSLP